LITPHYQGGGSTFIRRHRISIHPSATVGNRIGQLCGIF
jgi:hypothetical protein